MTHFCSIYSKYNTHELGRKDFELSLSCVTKYNIDVMLHLSKLIYGYNFIFVLLIQVI